MNHRLRRRPISFIGALLPLASLLSLTGAGISTTPRNSTIPSRLPSDRVYLPSVRR
jgi:hypothetical protein